MFRTEFLLEAIPKLLTSIPSGIIIANNLKLFRGLLQKSFDRKDFLSIFVSLTNLPAIYGD
jgi:hypothetical protein